MIEIHEAMAKISSEIKGVSKDKKSDVGYYFRGIDEVTNHLHPLMAKHGVTLYPSYVGLSHRTKVTKSGTEWFYVALTGTFTFIARDGSKVTATTIGEGSDPGDKAYAGAMSQALKYALIQVFLIPTEDTHDPDDVNPPETKTKDNPKTKTKKDNDATYASLIKDVAKKLIVSDEDAKTKIKDEAVKLGMKKVSKEAVERIRKSLLGE